MLHFLLGICRVSFFFLCVVSWSEYRIFAQTGVGVGSSHPDAEGSRTPLKVKLSGFINTKPEGDSTVIKLGIGIYRETYQFELVKMEAVDRERISSQKILDPSESREIAYDLTGPKDLLSKIAQSEPGTPLAITGFIQQRERRMQVTAVEIIGLEN